MNNGPIETKNYVKPKKSKQPIVMFVLGCVIGAVLIVFSFTAVVMRNADETTQSEMAIPMHIHNFIEWETIVEATCTEAGKLRSFCECGKEKTKETLKFGHTVVIDYGYAATKTKDGLTDGSHCERCGKIFAEQKVIYAGSQGLAYNMISNTTCEITGIGTCEDSDVVIPKYINGCEVTGICKGAFAYCDSLTSIIIPNVVTNIGSSAFAFCTNLIDIMVSSENKSYKSINGVLFTYDEKTIICYPEEKLETSYVIPNSVTKIESNAFSGCSNLTSIVLANGITSVGDGAFGGCSKLTSITIPNDVETICQGTFHACSSLIKVIIPNSVTSIDKFAFLECNDLTTITYNGTIAEWNTISKDTDWDLYTPNYTIYCTNGTIAKDGTITYN